MSLAARRGGTRAPGRAGARLYNHGTGRGYCAVAFLSWYALIAVGAASPLLVGSSSTLFTTLVLSALLDPEPVDHVRPFHPELRSS
jgi:hypothetical protein